MQRPSFLAEDKKAKSTLSTSKLSPKNPTGHHADDSAIAHGMRDILLVKCKQTIEELHLELEEEKKARLGAEESISKLERSLADKLNIIKEVTLRNQALNDENHDVNNKMNALFEQLEQAGEHLSYSIEQEQLFKELQKKYQDVQLENSELKLTNETLNSELRKRENVVSQWNETLTSVDSKILRLETEKEEIQQQKRDLVVELSALKSLYKESQHLNQLVQGKCEYYERLVSQLEQENEVLEELQDENKELQLTIDRLKEKSERLARDVSETLDQQEKDYVIEQDKLNKEYEKKYEEDVARLKKQYEKEIEGLELTAEGLKKELAKLHERLGAKEREIKEGNENFNAKLDQLLRDKFEEMRSLKSVIDEQSALIQSYEKISQKEKSGQQEELQSLKQTNKSLREEVLALQTKNSSLNQKLTECQDEINKITGELDNNFSLGEDKSLKLQEKANRLERELIDRDAQINLLKEETRTLRESLRLVKKEAETSQTYKRDYGDELLRVKAQLSQKSTELDEVKENQKEFSEVLQKRIEEVTQELRKERERRVEAEYRCTEFQEQVLTLESSLKKAIASHRTQLLKKEEEIDQMQYQRRMDVIKDVRETENFQNKLDNIDRTNRSPGVRHPPYTFRSSEARDVSRRNRQPSEVLGSGKSSVSKFDLSNTQSEPKQPEKTELLVKFKDVISQLENKLERISQNAI